MDDDDDWLAAATKMVELAMKMKDRMIKKGLIRARIVCPKCANPTFIGVLHQSRRFKHGYAIHCRCSHPGCDAMIME